MTPDSRQGEIDQDRTDNDVEKAHAALLYLADPESWGGDPTVQGATLYGHDTPYELARRALGWEDPYA
jgi:hypothetical protein